MAETFDYLDQIVKALPEQMRESSSELANLSKIKQSIEDLQRTIEDNAERIVEYNAERIVVPETGAIVTPPKQKFPMKVKIAIYLIALYCLIQIIKELVEVVVNLVGK